MMKPLAWYGSTCGRLLCAALLLGVISIRGRAQESSVSWVDRTTDFLGTRNSYCALFDKNGRMVRAVDAPDGIFHLPWAGNADLNSPLSFSMSTVTLAFASAR